VPESAIVCCGLERKSSKTWTFPFTLPAAVGVNVMLMEQLTPPASEDPHVFV
jgi:hypothetical protein